MKFRRPVERRQRQIRRRSRWLVRGAGYARVPLSGQGCASELPAMPGAASLERNTLP